jgi:hypothetical protein
MEIRIMMRKLRSPSFNSRTTKLGQMAAVAMALFGACMTAIAADADPAESAAAEPARTSAAIDEKAAEVVLRSAYFVAETPAFSFSWFITSDDVIGGREKITSIESGTTTLNRELGFVSRTERGDTYRDYYYNGKQFTVASPNQAFYATVGFSGTYDELVDRVKQSSGVSLPLWTMLSIDLPAKLVADVDAAAYLGTTMLAGHEVHHVAFSGPEEDWQIWISTDDAAPLPLMLIGTRTDLQGWPQYRVNMMDWDLAPETSAADFSYTPEEGVTRITLPWLSYDQISPESETATATGGN